MRGTALSSHWRISAPHVPTHQFASTKPLTKHTLHTYLNARHKTHGIVIQIQQPYSTLSFDTPPWIISITPIQPVSRALMTRPHKSIPSPRSSQCHAPPWFASTNQFHRPDPVVRPPWNTPINQSHHSHPASVAPPCRVPTNQSHLFDPVAPPWRVPASVTPQWRAPSNQSHLPDPVVCPMMYPINQSHRPDPARVAYPTAHPHKSIPSPWSSQCRVPPWQAPLN